MSIEVEHNLGEKELSRERKIEIVKNQLRASFGPELFEELYGRATDFFKDNKKAILRNKVLK